MFARQLGVGSAALVMAASQLLLPCPAASSFSPIAKAAERSKSPHSRDKVYTVLISHFKYQPDTLTVHVGDIVEWKNSDIVPHSATAVNRKVFDSGSIGVGASWSFTAVNKGTYDYSCILHPNMKAKLVVE
jgi:plastocyanin